MAIGTRSYARGYVRSGGLPPGIRALLIANVAIFVLQYFSRGTSVGEAFAYLSLVPAAVVNLFFVWQLATYMFLHAGIGHILWNMLALWMFGREFEWIWGTRKFLKFYFFCGIGAGVCVVIANYLFGDPRIATVGSSGAIYGILLASAVLWPNREILFYFLIPVKMKYFVMIVGAIAFLNSFNPASPVSDFAHLGGMLFGYLFLKIPDVKGFDPWGMMRESYRQWKLARARRKFQVYMRRNSGQNRGGGERPDRDRFIN